MPYIQLILSEKNVYIAQLTIHSVLDYTNYFDILSYRTTHQRRSCDLFASSRNTRFIVGKNLEYLYNLKIYPVHHLNTQIHAVPDSVHLLH